MPKRRYWLSVMGCAVLLTTALAACGTSSTPTTNTNTPKSGGSLIDAISQEPSSLMPGGSTQTFADLVDASIWGTLIYTTDQFTLAPGLLTEVPSIANGDIKVTNDSSGTPATESVTLKLRSGLKFSDGSPLTSDDIAFTIKTLSDPAYGDKNGYPASEIASVSTPDAQTTVVNTNTIDVAFLTNAFTDPLLFSPLSKAHYGSMAPADIAKDFTPSVTSGPFTVKERVKGDHITVVKNPNYYLAGKPYLNQVTFKLFPDANTEVTALQAGQIDTAYFLPVTALDTLKNVPGYKLFVPKSSPNYEALYLNLSNPILADATVRQAIAMGFDPKTEITDIQKGNAVATCDDSNGTSAHETNLAQNGYCPYGPNQTAKFDATAAGQLLDGDGWAMGSDGYRHKAGQTLDLRISTTSGRQYRLDSEQLFQAAMKNIGIKIDVNNYPSSQLFGPILFPSDSKYAKGNNQWDVSEFENSIGVDPDSHTIWDSDQTPPAGGSNLTYYNNPQVDQLEAQQLKTVDPAARNQLFHQIHVQILKDIPTIYLYAPLDLSEYRTNLHNYSPDSIGPAETWNIWNWWLS
jgi:peptide/nickel transport system substrate-binding protein